MGRSFPFTVIPTAFGSQVGFLPYSHPTVLALHPDTLCWLRCCYLLLVGCTAPFLPLLSAISRVYATSHCTEWTLMLIAKTFAKIIEIFLVNKYTFSVLKYCYILIFVYSTRITAWQENNFVQSYKNILRDRKIILVFRTRITPWKEIGNSIT